jgi:hypothetical protein
MLLSTFRSLPEALSLMCECKHSRNRGPAEIGSRALWVRACRVERPRGSRSSEDHLR